MTKAYAPGAGEDIRKTAQNMVALAKAENGLVIAIFNEVKLYAYPDTPVDKIVQLFEEEYQRFQRRTESRRTPFHSFRLLGYVIEVYRD